MHCPNCGKPIGADQAFCGECGARVDVASQPAPEPVAPTQPMPPQPTPPAAPAYDPAAYQQQYAQQQYTQPGYQQPYPQMYQRPQPPQPKKKTGLIIAIVAVAAVFVIGGVVGGILLLRSLSGDSGTVTPPSSSGSSASSGSSTGSPAEGYATPEAALAAEYPADWVYTLQSDDGDWQTYWVGPPNSEYTNEVVVERTMGDTWLVTEDIPIGGDDFDGSVTPEEEAVLTVTTFLDLIMQDRPLEAQQLCIPPFSEDPASAGYSNGDFISYQIVDVVAQDDMTFWIHTAEEWRWGIDEYEYYVVPTELGYYISELRPYGY